MYHGNTPEPPREGTFPPAHPAQPSQHGDAHPGPGANADAETTAPNGVSAQELAKAITIVERKRTRGKITRRVLVGVAAVGVCAGAVEFGPAALRQAGDLTKTELQNAFDSGVEAGRQALLNELAQLEGVTLEGAIGIAKLTQLAVQYVVVPLAKLTATIEGDALQVLIDAVSTARSDLTNLHVPVPQWLANLQDLLTTWRDSVQQLPQGLSTYATADIVSAEIYLEALQTKIRAEQSAQATPSPTK
jgi:hypothetical protein